jgi:hypothetical protein
MEILRYWREVLHRAWQEAWELVIQHSPKALIRNGVIFIVACALLHYGQGGLIKRHVTSADNLEDTIVWTVTILIAIVALFSAVFIIEALFITPFRMWRELNSQVKLINSRGSSNDLMRKFQSGEWEIAYPKKDTGANWTIRELFLYIEPDLANNPSSELKERIGHQVLDKLSTMQLSAYGRRSDVKGHSPLTYIAAHYWEDADFAYWFLDGSDHDQLVHAKGKARIGSGNEDYRDIQVNRREAVGIWPKKG